MAKSRLQTQLDSPPFDGRLNQSSVIEAAVEILYSAIVAVSVGASLRTVTDNDSVTVNDTTYTALPNHMATEVVLINNTGVDILFRYGTGNPAPLPNGIVLTLATLANSNELQVKQANAGANVTLFYHYEK